MSVEAYSSLQGAFSLMGIKADSADAALRRLAINLGVALSDPASKTAEAFHNLGISQEELNTKGSTTAGALKLLANAFTQTADSENKSAAMAQIFGRGFEEIIPILEGGGQKLEELEQKAKSLGITLTDDTAKKLQQAGESVSELGQRIRGDGIKAFENWAPAISGVVGLLGECLDLIVKVVGAVGKLPSAFFSTSGVSDSPQALSMLRDKAALFSTLNPTGTPSAGFGPPSGAGTNILPAQGSATGKMLESLRDVPAMTTPESVMAAMRQQMTAAALGASKGGDRQAEARAEIAVMQQTLATAKLTAEQRSQITTEMQQKEIQLNNGMVSAGNKAFKQGYADFAANERLKISEAQGSAAQITAIYAEWEKAAEGTYKQSAATVLGIEREKVQAVNAARLEEIKEGARLEEQQNRASVLMGQAGAIAAGTQVYPGQKTVGGQGVTGQGVTALAAQAQQIEASSQAEIAALTEVMNTATAGSNVQKAAAQEILSVETQAKQQEVELYNKAAEASVQAASKTGAAITKVFDSLGGQFETFSDDLIKALIAPQKELLKEGFTTKTFSMQGNEIRAAFSKMLLSGIQDATKGVQNILSQTLGQMISQALNIPMQAGGGLASVLSGGLQKLLGMGGAGGLPGAAQFGLSATQLSAAGATLNTAGASLNAAAAALSASAGAGGASDVGGGFSDLFGAAGLFAFSRGGIVPSAAGGMVVGGNGASLALVHSREMVLPAHLSEGIQSMITGGRGGGNSASLNYSPTIHTASRSRGGTGMSRSEFTQMMSSHSGAMFGEARNMVRNGWRPRS